MYQAPGQQHMAQMMQIMSVSQPPSLSSFLASNRSIRSGDIPSHRVGSNNLANLPQALNELTQHNNELQQLQNQHPSIHPNLNQQQTHSNPPGPAQLHQHLSPAHSGHNLGSPLSTQFDSNELKAHQHIRLPPSHSSLTTLKPPESILSGLTSITGITSQSRSRHAGSQFTALSQSDLSDMEEEDEEDLASSGNGDEEEMKLTATSDTKSMKKGSGKRFQFSGFNGYHPNPPAISPTTPPRHYSNNPMSVFNPYQHMHQANSECVSPSRTTEWSKSHFSGNGITLA